MCGICGVITNNGEIPSESLIKRMTEKLTHRGPDDEGYYFGPHIGIGMRRLSIIDLEGGHQPIHNETKDVFVICNGEIYNYIELKDELEKKGHVFYTKSDTECIVHAYEEYDEEFPRHLWGMFALAIWDAKKKKLILARDRVGKKPLVYAESGGKFFFASEFQSILESQEIRREVNLVAIDQYVTYGYVPAPLTAFVGIYKLLPGHILVYQSAKLGTRPYWSVDFYNKIKIKESDAEEAIISLLKDAVRLRLRSDVPLGIFLSGGIDSSTVAALATQLSTTPVKTFSIGFRESSYSELHHARRVANLLGTQHQDLIVKPNAIEILPLLVRHYGEPYADSSAIPTYYVSKVTSKYVKVALNGDGGDELFGGYERYLAMKFASVFEIIPLSIRRSFIKKMGMKLPNSGRRQTLLNCLKSFIEGISISDEAQRYTRWVGYIHRDDKEQFYSSHFKQKIVNDNAGNFMQTLFAQAKCISSAEKAMYADIFSYLPYDLLVKVDITSMANALEARSPFLDHRLIEFSAKLPCAYKLRSFVLKYILKKCSSRFIPYENIYRKKMGFGVPMSLWFRSELKNYLQEILTSSRFIKRDYFNVDFVRNLIHQHISGQRDFSFQLWMLIMLELWHREFID